MVGSGALAAATAAISYGYHLYFVGSVVDTALTLVRRVAEELDELEEEVTDEASYLL